MALPHSNRGNLAPARSLVCDFRTKDQARLTAVNRGIEILHINAIVGGTIWRQLSDDVKLNRAGLSGSKHFPAYAANHDLLDIFMEQIQQLVRNKRDSEVMEDERFKENARELSSLWMLKMEEDCLGFAKSLKDSVLISWAWLSYFEDLVEGPLRYAASSDKLEAVLDMFEIRQAEPTRLVRVRKVNGRFCCWTYFNCSQAKKLPSTSDGSVYARRVQTLEGDQVQITTDLSEAHRKADILAKRFTEVFEPIYRAFKERFGPAADVEQVSQKHKKSVKSWLSEAKADAVKAIRITTMSGHSSWPRDQVLSFFIALHWPNVRELLRLHEWLEHLKKLLDDGQHLYRLM